MEYHAFMSYGKDILERVAGIEKDKKSKFTVYVSVAVYEEFRRKCGEHAPSTVLEEMMKQFNETTPDPKPRKK